MRKLTPLVSLVLFGCGSPLGLEEHVVHDIQIVEKEVPVPVPCEEAIEKYEDADAPPLGASLEEKVFHVAQSLIHAREYMNRLSAVAVSCGVVVK